MNNTQDNKYTDPDILDSEIDLLDLLNVIWQGKSLILILTSLITIFTAVYSLNIPNFYKSESILVSSDTNDLKNFSQYSGLASMAGINLPGSSSNSVIEVMEIIQSRQFVNHLLTFENVLPSLMAADSYDHENEVLVFNANIYDEKTNSWLVDNGMSLRPSYLEAHRVYINEVMSISQDSKTGLVSVSVQHISPFFASELLKLIITEANNLKRAKDINISKEALDFLKLELAQTSLVEIKNSINQLIKAQLETEMMAKVNEDYSLVIIEPPFVPDQKFGPNRTLMVVLALLIGSFFSFMVVLLRHYLLVK